MAQNLEVQMNIVEPIKSIEDIQNIKRILSKKPRNALLFSFGINSGLRIADILLLDVKDVKGKVWCGGKFGLFEIKIFKTWCKLVQEKTGKSQHEKIASMGDGVSICGI